MKYIVVDVESDGPIIGTHSMVCIGAVLLDRNLDKTFYAQTAPIGDEYVAEALAISGFDREEHENFPPPHEAFEKFAEWIEKVADGDSVTLISDNNGYDASWVNWYFLAFIGKNPFGWTSRRIGDWFCGFFNNPKFPWKKYRDSARFPHNHHPVSDACGNASAVLYLIDSGFKLKI